MPKESKLQTETNPAGTLTLTKGKEKITLYLEDIAYLIPVFQDHFNKWDKLPF